MRCVVPNCNHDSSQTSHSITYYLFPLEPSLRAAWLEALHLTDWKPSSSSAVCSIHFMKDDLLVTSSGQRTVRAGAVPVIDVPVCRICFAVDGKLYPMTTYKIFSKAYETITGMLIKNEDNLPPYLCSECAHRLLNCARFKTRSLEAHSFLMDIVKNHGYVTLELIQSCKRIQTSMSSNQTSYDDEIDQNNEVINKENLNISSFPEDVTVNEIKTERDFSTVDTTNDHTGCTSNLFEYHTVNNIKIENDEVINRDNLNNLGKTDDNKACIYIVPENDVRDIKTENDYVINHENADAVTNNCRVFVSNLPEVVSDGDIKVEIENTVQDDGNEDSNSNKIEYEDAIEGEGNSSKNSIFLTEATQNTRLRIQDVTKVTRDSIQRNPGTDRGLLINNKLFCNVCSYQTNNKLHLLSHLKVHTATKSYSCNASSYLSIRRDCLTRHSKGRSGEKRYSCNVCSKGYEKKCDLIRHVRTHSGEKPYSCSVCNKPFNDKRYLVRHLRIHSGEKPYSCKICKKAFNDKSSLVRHLRIHTGEKPYSCNMCIKAFKHKFNLIAHMRTHSGEKPYSCNICNKSFYEKRCLVPHLRTHSGEKPYSCNVCNKTFKQTGHLITHMKIHAVENVYSCNVCNKSFYEKGCLDQHLKTHSGKKPYLCNVCNKIFKQKSNLLIHMKIHSVEKPYSCNICNKSFYEKRSLVPHLRTHSGEKPYSCNACNKTFNHRNRLITHMKTHSVEKPYSCKVCNKSYDNKCSLVRHSRAHSGKSYLCNVCNKTYNAKSSLVRHLRKHSGEKPYSCSVVTKHSVENMLV